MAKENHIIGVDLGGTWVRLALSNREGLLLARRQKKVDKSSAKAVSEQIARMIHLVCDESNVDPANLEGIGIASAGPLDLKKGALIKPTNLPFEYIPLTKPISSELGSPAYLVNDCTAAILGERQFGAGKGLDNLVYVTIGTGIGGGAIVDGSLLLGKDGNAVEIGHLTIDYEGRLICGCGKRGHWEAYCSGRNIPNFIRLRLEETNTTIVEKSLIWKKMKAKLSKLTSKDLFDAAKSGDALSLQLVEEIGVLNAIGLSNVVNAYDPSLVTLGGSVTLENEKLILLPIRKYVRKYIVNRLPKIMVTPLGEDVGIFGGIATVLRFGSQAASS